MDWIIDNLVQSLAIIGLLLLAIEIMVLGFSTFVLFFVGVAALLTSAAMYLNILPESVTTALLSIGILTTLEVVFLWKPLKNMQTKVDKTKAQGDLVGHTFVLVENVAPGLSPSYHYSGINWKLLSDSQLEAGTEVEVTDVEVGVFHIKQKQ
jgi:membrane protein implicated in regulation of membrane protease activity